MYETLMIFGVVLIVVGVGMVLVSKFGLPNLPGDILIQRDNFTFYLPIATSIVVSVILTLLFKWIR